MCLGWRHDDGRPLDRYEIYRLAAFTMPVHMSDRQEQLDDRRDQLEDEVSPAAAALARAALRR